MTEQRKPLTTEGHTMREHVEGMADIKLIDDPAEIAHTDSPLGKSFLRVQFTDGRSFNLTTNLAEMIGGAGAGLRKRREDQTGQS